MIRKLLIISIFLSAIATSLFVHADPYQSLRSSVTELMESHGDAYPKGQHYLDRLQQIEKQAGAGKADMVGFESLQCEALLDNPVLDGLKIICVKREWPNMKKDVRQQKALLQQLGFPANHLSMSSLERVMLDNEIGIYDLDTETYTTLYKARKGDWVGQINLHWDASKFLFTLADEINWKILEMNIDGTGLRQVSHEPDDVDCFEPCYLPDGRIVFCSNAAMQCIPCWHGVEDRYAANLYIMNSDGTGMQRLTFDQDHDINPYVRHNGQVLYSRWDYTGISRLYNRPLMAMNPDGTNQRAIYGSNSWFPNGLYSVKELPGRNGRFLGVLAGYHQSFRSGILAVIDLNKGTREDEGFVCQISGTENFVPVTYMDALTATNWPEFVTPAPISEKYFLTSMWKSPNEKKIGLQLADINNNVIPLFEEETTAILEPIPVINRKSPPVIPDRRIPGRTNATVYIQDIHTGPGLKGVPRGTVKDIRVIAYDFGYSAMAGMDKIGLSGPWEAMRILGTTPVEEDGSAIFKVPANTPIALQPLDGEGKAVQLMRTWMTAMPGEVLSCVGCHESTRDAPVPRRTIASTKAPQDLEEWYGPARGFDFAREVQPVLNRYCVSCHDQANKVDLRPEDQVPEYAGRVPGRFDRTRMHPFHVEKFDNKVLYTPAYEALLPYIRRVNVGDDVSLLEPGEYHADTSELVQLLMEGHYGVQMDKESWSRIVTWIDLNGPCHGTWQDVYNLPIPGNPDQRRKELAARYGGPPVDPDIIPQTPTYDETPVRFDTIVPGNEPVQNPVSAKGPLRKKTVDLGDGVTIELVNFGEFWWMAACEITNAQFARFDPHHSSRYYVKRFAEHAAVGKGLPLDLPDQPVLRVSYERAIEFCQWLSELSGLEVTLPSEQQWQQACLAGSAGPYHFAGNDFSRYENLADYSFANDGYKWKDATNFSIATDCEMLVLEGVGFADQRFDDEAVETRPAGSYQPNAYGLHDMHGNVAEWTTTDAGPGEKIVKGGSYLDRPQRAGVDVRHGYPPWQNVYNVGFRVIAREPVETAAR